MRTLWRSYLCLAVFALLNCSGERSTGNSTQTENAIAIQIFAPDGNPARGVAYTVLPMWHLADTTTAIDSSHFTYSGQTDSDGWIHIENHPEGSFLIQVSDDSVAVLTQYTLNRAVPRTVSDDITLRKRGSVQGWVSLPSNSPYSWILFYGLDRVVQTDSLGHFIATDLPVGDLTLLAASANASLSLGQASFTIPAGDTLQLGTLPSPTLADEVMETWRYSQPLACRTLISDWMRPQPPQTVLTLRLDSTNFDFAQALANGGDLRLLDPSGQLVPLQIAYWDSTAQRGVVRIPVNVPSDTLKTWTLKWGNRFALPASLEDVWSALPDSLVLAINSVLIADFENGSSKNALLPPAPQHSWYVAVSDSASISPASPDSFAYALQPADSGRAGTALHFTYSATYPKWALIGTRLGTEARSLAHMDSLEVWMRGDGEYTVALENLDLDRNWKTEYDGSNTAHWSRVVVRPADFLPADSIGGDFGWEPIRHRITTLTFFAKNGSDFWIDDIRIYGINRDDLK